MTPRLPNIHGMKVNSSSSRLNSARIMKPINVTAKATLNNVMMVFKGCGSVLGSLQNFTDSPNSQQTHNRFELNVDHDVLKNEKNQTGWPKTLTVQLRRYPLRNCLKQGEFIGGAAGHRILPSCVRDPVAQRHALSLLPGLRGRARWPSVLYAACRCQPPRLPELSVPGRALVRGQKSRRR